MNILSNKDFLHRILYPLAICLLIACNIHGGFPQTQIIKDYVSTGHPSIIDDFAKSPDGARVLQILYMTDI